MNSPGVTLTDAMRTLRSMTSDLNELGEAVESDKLRQAAALVAQAQKLIAAARQDRPELQEGFRCTREDFIENIVEAFGTPLGVTITRRKVPGGFDHVLEVGAISMHSRMFLRPLYPSFAVSRTIRLERPGTIVVVVDPEARGPVEAINGGASELAEFLL